jgi:peptidoglycan/xylan/chitin deacetylase (PgdA/CDA1 family)
VAHRRSPAANLLLFAAIFRQCEANPPVWKFLTALIVGGLAVGPAAAACGPDKLGTARIIEAGAEGGLLVGLKTYPRTLALADHEVILTFDDGPDPVTTPKVLQALADQCVRATFFTIGQKIEDAPELARREVAEGHNVAHHTFTHPQPTLRNMSAGAARADILRAMIAVERLAYGVDFPAGEPKDLAGLKLHAPFFRFPGFADTEDLKRWFAANNVAIFSTDLWASDWVPMTPQAELKLIMSRLETARRGIILLHDNRPWTAAMLPDFLRELKRRGYRVAHIVAGPGRAATLDAPPGWFSETEHALRPRKPSPRKPH